MAHAAYPRSKRVVVVGTPAGTEAQLIIRCDDQTVPCNAIRLLLEQVAPGISVEFAPADESYSTPGIRIEYGSERWMCVFRGEQDIAAASEALRAGAWCLSSLDDGTEQFSRATWDLVEGRPHHVPVSTARMMTSRRSSNADSEQTGARRTRSPLTRREREVLALVAAGLSNTEIAERLVISIHTVRTHLSSIATKIDAKNRIHLVSRARDLGYGEAEGNRG